MKTPHCNYFNSIEIKGVCLGSSSTELDWRFCSVFEFYSQTFTTEERDAFGTDQIEEIGQTKGPYTRFFEDKFPNLNQI
jgi:hypothetical protein